MLLTYTGEKYAIQHKIIVKTLFLTLEEEPAYPAFYLLDSQGY